MSNRYFVKRYVYSDDGGIAGMDLDWQSLPKSGKATVVSGALVALGTVLPWMSYSGGSASLLQDGKMEVLLSNGLSSPESATVATSQTLLVALLLAGVAIGLPLARGWDWKSSLPAAVLGVIASLLFAFSAFLLHGGGQEAVLVGGEQVAETATPGTGLYLGSAGAGLVTIVTLGHLVSAGLGQLRS